MLKVGLSLIVVMIAAALPGCGDDGEDVSPARASFPEGSLRIEIESLDTGLLKGHAFAEAVDGWIVSSFTVEARDDQGVAWQVIEPDVSGIGGADVNEFFEVVVQELPRGGTLTVEAVAILRDASGTEIERRVSDDWPP
jgi:hypothetical protein